MKPLEGKRVFVTGAGGALGRASARMFAREGAVVAVVDLDAAVAETAVHRLDGIDTLFNNAGVMPHQDRSLLDGDLELRHRISEINLDGTMLCSRYVVPRIIAAGGGAVLNMSSFLAVLGCSFPQDGYTASKGAISALTRAMAVQLGSKEVRVNGLAPGPVLTAHVERFPPDPDARQIRLACIPLRRFGEPADIAGSASFLVSDAAAWITGQVPVIDGGISSNYL
jgi:NAD(P)-dependent dehydrogenase (short-subunit alcohol dehydrogenase family)